MIQCKDCEFYQREPDGNIHFNCNPFENVKESECIVKWQLIKLDTMVRAYMTTVAHYKRLAPLQEKMMKAVEREMEEMEEGESWKHDEEDEEEEEEEEKEDDAPL